MNAHVVNKKEPALAYLVGIVLIGLFLLAIPVQQVEEAKAAESMPVLFSESGMVDFLNPQNGYPVMETLSPAYLGVEIKETQTGFVLNNKNDKFVFLIFYTPDGSESIILGPKEKAEIPIKKFSISMSFPNGNAIIGSPGNWVFRAS